MEHNSTVKAVEMAAGIRAHDVRQLVHLKYVRGMDPSMIFLPTGRSSFRTT